MVLQKFDSKLTFINSRKSLVLRSCNRVAPYPPPASRGILAEYGLSTSDSYQQSRRAGKMAASQPGPDQQRFELLDPT